MDILKSFEKNWRENIALPAGTLVLAACSGGIDSLALLDILDVLKDRLGIQVVAAHFEHGIRGQASLEDADFVREFCRRRGIDCHVDFASVPEEAARSGESLETAARRLRYDFLRRTAARLVRQEVATHVVIATAHHRDDQAETVLMHLIRGTGVRGLGGIRAGQGDLIRPLLFAGKKELAAYCQLRQLCPRHDATNDEADCFRNRLRLKLLPLLVEEYNPAIGDALCQLADLAQADEDYLQHSMESCWQELARERAQGFDLDLEGFLRQPLAMQRRLVQQAAWQASGSQLSYVQVQSVLQLAKNGRTGAELQLSFGLRAGISYDFLYIIKKTIPFSENNGKMDSVGEFEKIPLQVPGITRLPDGSSIVAELAASAAQLNRLCRSAGADEGRGIGRWVVYGDWNKCNQPLTVRHRRKGDRVNVGSGHKKLKDFLIDSRIPRLQRDRLWLVTCGSGEEERILWIPGVRRFDEAASDEQTKNFFIFHMNNEG